LINVFLTAKNSEVRGSMLGYINQYDEVSSNRIQLMTQNFIAKGYSTIEAEALSNKTMEGFLFRQQAMVSYNQGFFMVGCLILICIPVVLLIRYKKTAKASVVADH
jgi:DHA2 family multidrug resistance protein